MTGDNNSINSGKNYLIYVVIVIVFINMGVNIAQLYIKPNHFNEAQF